jgi:3-phosphoglycerate kinase
MQYKVKTIDDIEVGVKRVVMLVDFNVPVVDGVVEDDFRLRKVMPTIKELLDRNLNVVLISHIGKDGSESLKPVFEYLNNLVPTSFATTIEEALELVNKGERLILLENVRSFKGEAENDQNLSKALSSLGEIFINEGFSVSHRKHASVVGIPSFIPSYAGRLLVRELEELSTLFNPERPYFTIIGGLKASTKEPLIRILLEKADNVFVGGALANDFLKAKGFNVGASKTSPEKIDESFLKNPKLLLPDDVLVETPIKKCEVRKIDNILDTDVVVDIGPETIKKIESLLNQSKTLLWNGPLGWNEKGFSAGTVATANLINKKDCKAILGGGDTVSVMEKLNLLQNFSFVSTGGGAMLDFLVDGELPGLNTLLKN